MTDEMQEVSPQGELMRVAARIFKQFLSELNCKAGSIEVTGNTYKIVTIKGNNAHFTRGEIDV